MKKILTAMILALSAFATTAYADYSCTVSSSTHNYTRSGHTYNQACNNAMSACVHNTSHHDSCHVQSH